MTGGTRPPTQPSGAARALAAVALGAVVVVAVPAWLFYGYFILAVGLEGENCTDADPASCADAAPLPYGVFQAALVVLGLAYVARALHSTVGGRPTDQLRGRWTMAACLAVTWLLLVALRALTSGRIY
jgi:hypothetical protein